MSLAPSRHAARLPRRVLEAPSRAVLSDSRFERLRYLHGWWYGAADFLGFPAVRLRLPGDLSGPSERARKALLALEREQHLLERQTHPYLWAAYLTARDAQPTRRTREAHSPAAAGHGMTLREHYRLEAVCAGAFGEADLVELAIEPRWTRARVFGAYVQHNMLLEFRANIGLWRTPPSPPSRAPTAA